MVDNAVVTTETFAFSRIASNFVLRFLLITSHTSLLNDHQHSAFRPIGVSPDQPFSILATSRIL